MVIPGAAERAFDKTQLLFMKKTFNKLVNILHLIEKPSAQSTWDDETGRSPPKIRNETRMFTLMTFI